MSEYMYEYKYTSSNAVEWGSVLFHHIGLDLEASNTN